VKDNHYLTISLITQVTQAEAAKLKASAGRRLSMATARVFLMLTVGSGYSSEQNNLLHLLPRISCQA